MSVKIIVDSTADMTPAVAARVGIVPLTVHFGGKEYTAGVDIDNQKFYEMLVENDTLPTTSQPTPFAFSQEFQKAVDAGYEVICLTCSGKLSGTNQSANIAAEDFDGKVTVVDSNTIAIGLGILAEYALNLVDRGLDARQILEQLEQQRKKVRLLALVDTLEYLKKGGRISPTVAFAGGLLNIKPVIAVSGGEIVMLGKARGSKQGNHLLVQEIENAGGVDFNYPLMLGYTGLSDTLLQKYIADSEALWQGHTENLPISLVGSVVGTHAGPGAVAVAFFAKDGE
ncbi:MAG: DegV family protein [Oscillospiraceae bacterium]|nr:DegV family protein [Oscillospiraceae bacterium]